MSIGNLKDSGNQGNNFPWQLKMLQGLQLIADSLQTGNVDLDDIKQSLLDILNELADQTSTLAAINNDFTDSFKGTFTPEASSGLSFPYNFPAGVYKAVTIIIPTGETLKMNGVVLPAGTYNFSGEGSQVSNTFFLSDPSTAGGANIVLLTVQ